MLIIYVISIPLGIAAAVRRGSWFDHTTSLFVFMLWSMPSFWLATLLIMYFSSERNWNLLPSVGLHDLNHRDMPYLTYLWDWGLHTVLPMIVLVYAGFASLSRYARTSLLETISQDYVRTARAKGLSERVVVYKHAFRNSLIAIITLIGVTKGLKVLDVLEGWGLYVTLLIIVLLLAGFAHYDWMAWRSDSGIVLVKALDHTPWEVVTILAGTLIVVQGFETPRYLGGSFDTDVRVSASRWSQIISTAVYILFVALALPVVHTLGGRYDDDSLIALVGVAASLLVIPLIVAAALSQFSAAVADTLSATGNMQESTHGHLKAKWGCGLVGGGAIALTWSASTLEIRTLASRAFAFYYMLQCLVAISVSKSPVQRAGMAVVAAALGFITVFAVPAS